MISFDPSQIFLVTGAISGISRATALGGTVICAARDEQAFTSGAGSGGNLLMI